MLSAAGSSLVAGSAAPAMRTQWVRIVRAVYLGSEVQPVGAIVEVQGFIAEGWVQSGKAVIVPKPEPKHAPEPEPTPEVEPEPVPAPRKRGKKDAWK